MKHLYLSFLCCTFFLFTPDIFANSPLRTNVAIGGIINSYGAISNIAAGSGCSSTITVDDASGFMPGDYAWVIQMQGATINESNSSSFGDITSLNSAGLFEKVQIESVNGNQITTSASLLNTYQIAGKVQIVSAPQYIDAEVTTDVTAMPWDGNKGGILAFEVLGTLTLQANIDASMSGFRGGTTSNSSSNCTAFIPSADYHYPIGTWESEGKGEGIAAYIPGKEYGRGAQANGGGGGNDHNSGGGGGAGFASGGLGGENLDPGFFNCHGNDPGVGGKATAFSDARLFLGGGGGAGSENNNQSTNGGIGGGIILLSANFVITNGFSILANGEDNVLTLGLDGGGGGGGGGTASLQITTISGTLNVETKGGKGSDTRNLNQDRCMGPGGGGGGGAIYTNLNAASLNSSLIGGQPGIVTLSTTGCNGSSNNGLAGNSGSLLPMHHVLFNPGENSGLEVYTGCQGDGYSLTVNGVTYNESNPTGTETLTNQFGCDSSLTIILSFVSGGSSNINPSVCEGDSFTYNGVTYDASNPTGTEVLSNASINGCDSTVSISLNFISGGSSSINPTLCEGESFNYNGVTYNASNPTGTEVLSNASANGCDSTVSISLNFTSGGSSILTESLCWNESYVYNGTEYTISMPSGQEILANASSNGCDSIVNVDLSFSTQMTISETANADEVTINITGGVAPFDINWDNGMTGMTNTLTESGNYTIFVADAYGCSNQYSFYFAVTSNEDIKVQYGLDIFPNPVQDVLTIQRTEIRTDWNVKLMNISGQEVRSHQWQNGEKLDMDVSDLPKGIYVLNIYSDEINFAEKIVIGE